MSDERDQPKDDGRMRALVEVVTENGFSIVRLSDLEKRLPCVPYEYHFMVRSPDGIERNITVRFSNEAISLVQLRRRPPLTCVSSYWISCAERSLATYLLEKNHFPPDEKFILEELCLDELEIARRWYEVLW
ncbi:MAG: hypothetical protein DMF68_12065 [Acidobacteria bacterium]|nr:MAG: hypothetical protein DMF68_12065 [Acidobacteriota bacterium]